jgi:predicted NAD-dependent protein-ADP-ribosyltransferase YbiA (DUF1768 family)
MMEALRHKFYKDPDLMRELIETTPRPLHEDSPYDMYWGIKGKDMLGKMLMSLRDEINEMRENVFAGL